MPPTLRIPGDPGRSATGASSPAPPTLRVPGPPGTRPAGSEQAPCPGGSGGVTLPSVPLARSLKRLFVGTPLPTAQSRHERLDKRTALAVFASDALSSVAYATEEILLVLVLAGTVALSYSLPIGGAI